MDQGKLEELQAAVSKELDESTSNAAYFGKPRHVSKVMALILNVLDLTSDDAKLEAISYLTIVLERAAPEVLDTFGYFDVIFDALFRIVNFQNIPLLDAAYACFLKFLTVFLVLCLKKPRPPKYGQLDYADRMLLQSLQNVLLFHSPEIHACLIENIISLVLHLGFRSSKFLPRMLSVSDHLIQSGGYEQQVLAGKFLLRVSSVCAPAIANHSEKIVLQAMRVMLHTNPATDSPVVDDISSLFMLLMKADRECFDFIQSVLRTDPFNRDFRDKIDIILSRSKAKNETALTLVEI